MALKYRQLWMVEQLFRSTKALLDTRPIFHQRDQTNRGYAFCSFLALVLRKAFQDRLQAKGYAFEWADVMADLDMLQQIHVQCQDKHFLLCSQTQGHCGEVFQEVGVAVPSTVQHFAEQAARIVRVVAPGFLVPRPGYARLTYLF